MNAMVDGESDLVGVSGGDGEPVEQNSTSTVLDELKLRRFFFGVPKEQGVAVLESGRHKGVDEFLCVSNGKGGTEPNHLSCPSKNNWNPSGRPLKHDPDG